MFDPTVQSVFFRENDQVVFCSGKSLVNEIHATCFYSHAPKWYFSSKYPVWGREGQVIGTSWFVGRVMVRLSNAIRQDLETRSMLERHQIQYDPKYVFEQEFIQ
jgi:hypothetical protein